MKSDTITCSRCLLDTTVSSIRFDENGVCNFCKSHDVLLQYYPQDAAIREKRLHELVDKIKKSGKNKQYDCIIGVSGGTDSTYSLYLAKKLGLRPLAVFFDNGWSTDISVSNIKKSTSKLGIDLFTYVVDWEEFKSIQVAFLKASVPCIEIPTDVAISGTLYKLALQEGVKYILTGMSFTTEGMVPREWSYIDGTYVKDVVKKLGSQPLKTYPMLTVYQIFYYTFFKGIKSVPFLNYVDYDKVEARKLLERELDWQYYGGHHYENQYSHFAFGWVLPKKFNIDKRKVSLSGPVRMGFMSREAALEELKELPKFKPEIIDYCINKLGLTKSEFEAIMNLPLKTYKDYHTSHEMMQRFSFLLKIAVKLRLVTPVAYEKFVEHD